MQAYFLNVFKEKGMTSFDVIYKLRKILNIKKIGHSGTLDPLAQGVLQVGVGGAARLLDYLDDDKCYKARIKFGYISDTCDDEGEKIFVSKPNFTREELISGLKEFSGKIKQIPPKYSAVKIGGKKLCDLARKGVKLPEIKPRDVEIYKTELINFNGFDSADIFIHCSKGTYIRSIVRDLGENLGCGAYMSDLLRTRAGVFCVENAVKINENISQDAINPIDILNLNKYYLNSAQYNRVKHGNPIQFEGKKENDKKFMLIFNDTLVSIADLSDNILKIEKVFETE